MSFYTIPIRTMPVFNPSDFVSTAAQITAEEIASLTTISQANQAQLTVIQTQLAILGTCTAYLWSIPTITTNVSTTYKTPDIFQPGTYIVSICLGFSSTTAITSILMKCGFGTCQYLANNTYVPVSMSYITVLTSVGTINFKYTVQSTGTISGICPAPANNCIRIIRLL